MQKKAYFFTVVAFIIGSAFTACGPESTEIAPAGAGDYEGLVTLFNEFREFQRPKEIDGVPDYTASAMSEQYSRVREYQQRLAAIDIGAWPVAQQVDYHVVRAEMNGLEFEHRVPLTPIHHTHH